MARRSPTPRPSRPGRPTRIFGVDTGGTFTDLVLVEGPEVRVAKVPSTPGDPARAILAGLDALGGLRSGDTVVHGTTVALNALLTGEVARVALVTNEGFRDLVEIGRQERPDIYARTPRKARPLVARELRFELPQRTWRREGAEGTGEEAFETVRAPSAEELDALRRRVERSRAESVAVCLLSSWAVPAIEEEVATALAPLGLEVTTSAGILREHREFERFSTAIVNAALAPRMRRYLGTLTERLQPARLTLLQSSGGTLSAERAAREPVRVILSGPAGGVVGAARAAREAGFAAFAGLDMGGTSTDVSFHRGPSEDEAGRRALEPVLVAGHPVAVPALDLHTIGCGGGSLVTVDGAGALHVGPESAGADPGPVAYGASDVPTVTDAHVLLGHVATGAFAGGALELDTEGVRRAFERLGERLGTSAERAAEAVLEVARAQMRRALGVMTMQRGEDPERLPLVAFGGAGGLHAAALAQGLSMPAALVPARPGALSAAGMANAEPTRELSRTVLAPLASLGKRGRATLLRELAQRGTQELLEAGHRRADVRAEHGLDLRYRGQSYELSLPEGADPAAAFHALHERLYGYALPDREVELVCLRTRVRVERPEEPRPRVRARPLPRSAELGRRAARLGDATRALVVDRERLGPGHRFEGPAIVEEYSGTTLVPPGWRARVTAGGHLLLEPPR